MTARSTSNRKSLLLRLVVADTVFYYARYQACTVFLGQGVQPKTLATKRYNAVVRVSSEDLESQYSMKRQSQPGCGDGKLVQRGTTI